MNIQQNNYQPNFQANIKFVNSKEFEKHCFHSYFYCGKPKEPLQASMLKGSDIWTPSVRTCTAGGVVDKDGAVGFHLFDSAENVEKVKRGFLSAMKSFVRKPESSIVIGSKELPTRPESIPLFDTIYNSVKKIVKPSIFKTHKDKLAETDIGYEKSSDTWFVVTSWRENPMMINSTKEVTTLDELKNSFEKIKIAPNDRLFVMNKEITRDTCPEMF